MTNWKDPTERAKNAVSYVKLVHTFFGIYIWELISSLNVDWTYVRNLKQAQVSMTFRFLNRYCLLLALIGLTLAFDIESEIDCGPLYAMTMLCSNIALELASICLTFRIIAAWVSGRWALCRVALVIILVSGLLAQAGLLFYAPIEATWMPRLGCVITTGLSNNLPTIGYTFVTTYFFILFVLAGWKYASPDDAVPPSDRLSVQELRYFGVAFIATAVNTIFIWKNLNPVMEIIALTPSIIVVSIVSCRVIAIWNDPLRAVEPPQTARHPPSPHRHRMMSRIGWALPLFGPPAHIILNTPAFRRLSSATGSYPAGSMEAATSAPSFITLPSVSYPPSMDGPRLSQGQSSRIASGSDSSVQGDRYDLDAQLTSTERNIV